jgi:hypothetical protein
MRAINATDRLAIAALVVADVGIGVFLIGVGLLPGLPVVHVVVGCLALLLALPALAAVVTGRLPGMADEGVLVNVGVMLFAVLEVFFLPAALAQRTGLAILLLAAVVATAGLYLRLFGVLRLPRRGDVAAVDVEVAP